MKNTTSYNDAIEKAEAFKKPYGKFMGRPFAKIPDWHLKWLAENAENDLVATNADIVMHWRDKNDIHVDDEERG